MMKHESNNNTIEIVDAEETFESIYAKGYLSPQVIDEVKSANMLIIPYENFRDKGDILFPETTEDLLVYAKGNAPDQMIVDIAADDNAFQKIELHSAVIHVAKILVEYGVLPIATSMIASFLYDLVKKYRRTPEQTSAKLEMIVEDKKKGKTKKIKYEGPVSGVEEALKEATAGLFSEK